MNTEFDELNKTIKDLVLYKSEIARMYREIYRLEIKQNGLFGVLVDKGFGEAMQDIRYLHLPRQIYTRLNKAGYTRIYELMIPVDHYQRFRHGIGSKSANIIVAELNKRFAGLWSDNGRY